MRQQVLKALANPARIFYVPYKLALLNFVGQFFIFIIIFVIDLTINGVNSNVNPMYFLISLCIVHMILASYSKKDPQLGQILAAWLILMRHKIPKKLAA